MSEDFVIKAEKIEKKYKLYQRNRDRVLDAFGLSGKKERFRYHYALNGVDFEVKKGETVGIIGTNGSGKSTLLKILTGVLTPTAGTVQVKGRISALLELGAGFNMDYNGIENIYLNGTMMGFSKEEIDARIDDILAFADIGEYINQPCKTYSSGMFVRLAFAVSINIDPEILIVDEALSVGDVFFQAKCYRKFEDFKKQGKTILFVSHDLSSVSRYCDRVYLLNKGEMLGSGSPKEMIDKYKQILAGQAEEGKTEIVETGENDTLEYGNGKAKITDYYITDEKGKKTSAIIKGTEYTVHMKVKASEDLPAPIFACSVKNVRGVEITGTNTLVSHTFDGSAAKGDEFEITFRQRMMLQGGEYLISLGCTGYEGSDFKVYHRLYDIIGINVISDSDTVGFYDSDSEVVVFRKE
ncbi:MAG: ABC transporter ATP-binding protein [Lachnospiraceae bacterium]|nr:ABC transporter ATP-binding protein [Lachnospiraceae bacterium]MBP1584843.1 ABC transporter ATP-binding protein [Lachnospiraceae bacterium]